MLDLKNTKRYSETYQIFNSIEIACAEVYTQTVEKIMIDNLKVSKQDLIRIITQQCNRIFKEQEDKIFKNQEEIFREMFNANEIPKVDFSLKINKIDQDTKKDIEAKVDKHIKISMANFKKEYDKTKLGAIKGIVTEVLLFQSKTLKDKDLKKIKKLIENE